MPKKSRKILIIGPFPQPITGLNVANLTVKELLEKNNHKVSTIDMEINRGLDNSIGKWKWYKLKIFLIYLESYKIFKAQVIYCTIGQSFLGILKYAPFLLISTILNKKKIVHLHGNALIDNYQKFSPIKKLLASWCLRSFDIAIVLSDSLKRNFSPFLNETKIKVINNFVRLDKHSIKLIDSSVTKILFLSNLLPAKGIIPFLNAVEILNNKGYKIEVTVAGSLSQDHPEIKDMMKRLTFLNYEGKVNGVKKANLFKKADIFCLPTLNQQEGQPLAILEAFASGCYIIASDVPGIADIFSQNNGALLWPVTSNKLFQLMEYAVLNKDIVEETKRYNLKVAENFSILKFEEKIIPLLIS